MANLGLIDFKLGLYIKTNLKSISQKKLTKMAISCHKISQMPLLGITRSFSSNFDAIFLNARFWKTNQMVTIIKLYFLWFRFWFLPQFLLQFLLRDLTWAVLHVWTQNYPQNFGACPGLPLQLLARNPFFSICAILSFFTVCARR